MSALDSVLGYRGEPVACRKVGELSVHWYPTDSPPGTPCLCGERRNDLEHVEASTPQQGPQTTLDLR